MRVDPLMKLEANALLGFDQDHISGIVLGQKQLGIAATKTKGPMVHDCCLPSTFWDIVVKDYGKANIVIPQVQQSNQGDAIHLFSEWDDSIAAKTTRLDKFEFNPYLIKVDQDATTSSLKYLNREYPLVCLGTIIIETIETA